MSEKPASLPLRANLDWYRKLAKKKLKALTDAHDKTRSAKSNPQKPVPSLARVQLQLARDHGFTSWRALVSAINAQHTALDPDLIARFFKAINGKVETVRRLLDQEPRLALARRNGQTPLHHAAGVYRAGAIPLLAERGADLNAHWADYLHTPLSWAVTCDNPDACAALVAAGAKVDLWCAAGLGMLDRVQAFFDSDGKLKPNASISGSSRINADGSRIIGLPATDIDLMSDALYIACRANRTNVIPFLLDRGADPNFRGYLGATCLHWAYFGGGERPIIQAMLEHGGDAALRDYSSGYVPRAFGVCNTAGWGWTYYLRRILQNDPTLATISDEPGTPLRAAAKSGKRPTVALLLQHGADPTIRDRNGNRPIDVASAAARKKLADLLGTSAAGKWSVDALPERRKSHKIVQWKPIMDAAFAGDVATVKKLLDGGADPNVISSTPHRHRPLHRAIERKKTAPRNEKHIEVVRLLLDRGADPHLRGTHGGHTALQLAAIDSPMFVDALRDRFKPLDIWHAIVLGDAARAAALLKKDRKLASQRDANEWLPLHYCAASAMYKLSPAAAKAQLKIAQMLFDAGADPNGTYAYGEWPLSVLFYACGYHDNPALTELLMKAGANPCDNESVYHASDEKHAASLAVIERLTDPQQLATECTVCLPTQLHWGHTAGMPWLLAHGADPTVKGRGGRSALEIAEAGGKTKLLAQLKAARNPSGPLSR